MGDIITIAIGFIGCGGLAAIAWYLSGIFGKKSDIAEAIHKVIQKIGIDKIKEIEKKQEVIIEDINTYVKVSEGSKKKIEDIKVKANEKIKEIIGKDSFVELSKEEDELWN